MQYSKSFDQIWIALREYHINPAIKIAVYSQKDYNRLAFYIPEKNIVFVREGRGLDCADIWWEECDAK